MYVYLVMRKKSKAILAACMEKAEAEDIASKYEDVKISKYPLINSLGNPWLMPEQQRKILAKEARLRHKSLDMAWCDNVKLVEIENKGHILWIEFTSDRVRRIIGTRYVEENFPDMKWEGIDIHYYGRDVPEDKPKKNKTTPKNNIRVSN